MVPNTSLTQKKIPWGPFTTEYLAFGLKVTSKRPTHFWYISNWQPHQKWSKSTWYKTHIVGPSRGTGCCKLGWVRHSLNWRKKEAFLILITPLLSLSDLILMITTISHEALRIAAKMSWTNCSLHDLAWTWSISTCTCFKKERLTTRRIL